MEPGEGDELEGVPHPSELPLEAGDCVRVELLPPVEGGGAVIREKLPGELVVDRLREGPGLLEVGSRGLAPEDVCEGCVREPPRDRRGETASHPEEAFLRTLSREERPVPPVRFARDQAGAVRVRPSDEQG